MEHLVQFTFSVDDAAIQRRLEESAYKDVVDELRRNVESTLPRKWSYDKGGGGGMSAVEYTRCDDKGCGNVAPDDPEHVAHDTMLQWGRLVVGGRYYDLCPDCAKKALEAVGIEVER